ncbi:unnamed protein product [Toxocara canis]|uniref:RRM domain-containing protein n=1 Tax=Toxocara canis TaxID=6265 RepID=A0A183TXR8_TOXCA|nr:unnamed protein product [Toxocara canis]
MGQPIALDACKHGFKQSKLDCIPIYVFLFKSSQIGLQGQNSKTVSAQTNSDYHSEEIFSRRVFIGSVPSDVAQGSFFACSRFLGGLKKICSVHLSGGDCEYVFQVRTSVCPLAGYFDRGRDFQGSTRAGKYQTGYLFVVYEDELSVQMVMRSCYEHEGNTHLLISSPTSKHKSVPSRALGYPKYPGFARFRCIGYWQLPNLQLLPDLPNLDSAVPASFFIGLDFLHRFRTFG